MYFKRIEPPLLTDKYHELYEQQPWVLFIWKSNPGSCGECSSRNNKVYSYKQVKEMGRPPPNCLCRVEVDARSLKDISNPIPAPIFGRDKSGPPGDPIPDEFEKIIYSKHNPGPLAPPILPWNVPEDVDIEENIERAKELDPFDFYKTVKNKGEWDYKQRGRKFQEFGNFNYGATGKEVKYLPASEQTLKRAAGYAQWKAGTSQPEWGDPLDLSPDSGYGDDPEDQEMIEKGFEFHDILKANKKKKKKQHWWF